jgi:hypothetical protein
VRNGLSKNHSGLEVGFEEICIDVLATPVASIYGISSKPVYEWPTILEFRYFG